MKSTVARLFLFSSIVVAFSAACAPVKNSKKLPLVESGSPQGKPETKIESATPFARKAIWIVWDRVSDSLSPFPTQEESPYFLKLLINKVNRSSPAKFSLSEERFLEIKQMAADVFSHPLDSDGRTELPYLDKVQLNVRESGSCEDIQPNHKAAAVSNFAENATVCFSVQEIAKSKKEDVFRDVIGELAHQMAHLKGYGEANAQLLQKIIEEQNSESNFDGSKLSYDLAAQKFNLVESNYRSLVQGLNDKSQTLEIKNLIADFKILRQYVSYRLTDPIVQAAEDLHFEDDQTEALQALADLETELGLIDVTPKASFAQQTDRLKSVRAKLADMRDLMFSLINSNGRTEQTTGFSSLHEDGLDQLLGKLK